MSTGQNALAPLPQLKPGEALVPSEMRVAHLRGVILDTQETVYNRSLRYANDPDVIGLGSVYLPHRALLEGISVEGSSGAGKSLYIRQIERRLLNLGYRLLIWDYKGRERQYIDKYEHRC